MTRWMARMSGGLGLVALTTAERKREPSVAAYRREPPLAERLPGTGGGDPGTDVEASVP